MKSLLNWKLRSKIILHILIIGSITAFFISYFYTKSQKDIIRATSQQTFELVGGVIEKSILETMKEGRSDKVQAILKNISTSQNIQALRILSPEGKILVSSIQDEKGTQVEKSTQKKLDLYLSGESRSKIFSIRPPSHIEDFRAIKNSKECFGCHNSDIDILGILEMSINFSPVLSIWKSSQPLGIIVSIVALCVLTFIILRLFEKIINRPIFNLKNRMEKIQEGDFTSKVPIVKDDEIGDLAKSFNIMITKLEEANTRIEELHEKQMEKAEHLASLGEIAAGLAHDIRNPIAGMKGAIEIIHNKTDDTDSNKDVFKEVLVQIDKIDKVIRDLLRFARPKEMDIRVNPVKDCIENAIKLAQMQVKKKDIQFHFSKPDKSILARLDADKIQNVLLNLLLNSVAAIHIKGNVTVELSVQNEKNLIISVSDDGSGIPKEKLSNIFQPFFTTKSDGTGLGLSICSKIITAHSGKIDVESTEGRGTTFTICLPVLESKSIS